MSTTAMARPRSAGPGAAGNGKVSFMGVLRSEFIKFSSLLSTLILVLATIVVMVGIAAVVSWGIGFSLEMAAESPEMAAEMGDLGGIANTLPASGLVFAQLIVGALAVMVMSSEFTTGSARSTFVAVPNRQMVFWAKALMVTIVAAVVALVSILLSFLVVKPIVGHYNLDIDFSSEAFQRSLWFSVLYVVMVALIGMALGGLLRNSAGGIVVLAALFFVLPMAMGGFSTMVDWLAKAMRFLPDQAGTALTQLTVAPGGLEQWQNGLLMAAWSLIPLILAALVLQRRDI
ncbi:ABC transporter permease [Paeniglutamicibacter sp. Y32M11]|uniref:ABC transporter permease n=1 Tax=Paeniglutamicibacter sp. Y32M11 TaxID=2853258 RepID=UPI002102D408|nr:ABC transporter permease [Paeniglutamicibacter sp. Y32M11]